MVTTREVDRQLKAAGVKRSFIIRAEIKELQHVLVPGEQVQYCLAGRYEGGFAMLCATDQRMLLIDKKPFYLTMEDFRYDMVSEVDFNARLIDSNVRVCTPNKDLRFRSFQGAELRKMTAYMQNRIMEFRQQHMMQPAYTEPVEQPVQPQAQVQAQPQAQDFTPSRYYLQTDVPQPSMVQPKPATTLNPVSSLQHRIINPYLKVPLTMRRRISRYPSL